MNHQRATRPTTRCGARPGARLIPFMLASSVLAGCYVSTIAPLGELSLAPRTQADGERAEQVATVAMQQTEPTDVDADAEAVDGSAGAHIEVAADPDAAHAALFAEHQYPTATLCKTCHPDHYRQWSVSQHAYAQISPIFNSMQARIDQLTNGTNGDFCMRCHTVPGMQMGLATFLPASEREPIVNEGVTCITCHRRNQAYGKISARFSLVEGDIFVPVYGPNGGDEIKRVIEDEEYKVVTEETHVGRPIHVDSRQFFHITEPGFCGACHDVTSPGGFRLEEAFSEYKQSPAARKGQSCQDCHMVQVPGDPDSGYAHGPAAVVGGVPTKDRKLTNHMLVGPDYSIVHPGIFPQNPDAAGLASFAEWVKFDHRAGWGTDEFEDQVDEDATEFPERWATADDRYDAREVVDEQLALLEEARQMRLGLLRRGYVIQDVTVERADDRGLGFSVVVANGTDGHNVPTGFTAERLVWLEVNVVDADGKVIFRSGDLDPNGDVRDLHSLYVHNHELPLDEQLFSLQSRFITRNVRGGEREQILAVNHSFDALPFIRPEGRPSILSGRPQDARIHKMGIEPGGSRTARYEVDGGLLTGRAPYRAIVRLKAAMVPVNLVSAIQQVGFDFDMSPRQIASELVRGHSVLWEREVELTR